MHSSPRNSLLSIEKELQIIDEEFATASHGQPGTNLNQADDSDLFKEIGQALEVQYNRSEQIAQTLEESFHEEENELDFPVHIGHAVGDDADESLQMFIKEMRTRDNASRNFQGTLKDSLKHIENIRDIILRGNT